MTLPRMLLAIGLAAGLIAVPAYHGAAAQPLDAVDSVDSVDDGAYRGYLAVRLAAGGQLEVIEAHNADRLFVPASVLKLVTVATALHHLGADYRWLTRLTADGPVRGGVLGGDLVIEPAGDPTWGDGFYDGGADAPLAALAEQLRARGLTRVTGDLVVDGARFPGRPHPGDRSFSDLPYRFGTPTTGLAVDEATITVRVAPGAAVGEPARVTAPAGVEVINHTSTVGPERRGAGTLDFVPVWGTDTLLLRGEYPINEPPFVVAASDPAPELRAARRLRAALASAGVRVDGAVRLGARAAVGGGPDSVRVLAELHSRPLGDLLERVLTDSHNWYADMLTLTLAKEVAGTGRFDDGVEVVADFVSEVRGDPSGDGARARAGVSLTDGSGLSSSNLVTPRTLVQVLAHALQQPWGQTLIGALAQSGEGTLAAWPALPATVAKTGTLRHTVALAGVLDAGAATPVLFCYFVNHHLRGPADARRQIASAVRRWRAAGER